MYVKFQTTRSIKQTSVIKLVKLCKPTEINFSTEYPIILRKQSTKRTIKFRILDLASGFEPRQFVI